MNRLIMTKSVALNGFWIGWYLRFKQIHISMCLSALETRLFDDSSEHSMSGRHSIFKFILEQYDKMCELAKRLISSLNDCQDHKCWVSIEKLNAKCPALRLPSMNVCSSVFYFFLEIQSKPLTFSIFTLTWNDVVMLR